MEGLNMQSTASGPGIFDRALLLERREEFVADRRKKQRYEEEEFAEFSAYILGEDCERDLRKLKNGDYFISLPVHLRIPKDLTGRKRDLFPFFGTEKYLCSLLAYVLQDYDHIFSPCLYSYRSTSSAKDFLLKLRTHPDINKYYIVKADITDYACSIVPEKLISLLEKNLSHDPEFLAFLKYILLRRKCIERDGSVVSYETGALIGTPIAVYFMNVYLMEMDFYYQNRAPLYCRYADDIIIFAETREEAEHYLAYYYETLEKMNLRTNQEKTQLIEPGDAVDILGCSLKNGQVGLSEHSKYKLKRKIRLRAKKILKEKAKSGLSDWEAASRMLSYCHHLFFSKGRATSLSWARWLFPIITNPDCLRELDHYILDAIRYVYSGNFTRKRFLLPYEDLKKMGFISLLHAYYHFLHEDQLEALFPEEC